MKKSILTLFCALSISAMAQTEAPAAQWGNVLHTVKNNQANAVACTADGTAYWLVSAGTVSGEGNADVFYNGEAVCTGSPYDTSLGNSQDNSLCLLATNPDGTKKWVVYSDRGDYAANAGAMGVDSKGNVVIAAKVRHSYLKINEQMNFIDAAGQKVEFGGTVDYESNYGPYGILLAKFNSNGERVWHKYLKAEDVPDAAIMPGAVSKGHVTDGVHLKALVIDAEDNIYIAGRYIMPLALDEGVTLAPRNVATFNGDGTQGTGGNLFIAKYDTDGAYLANAIGNDGLHQTEIMAMEWADGAIYVQGGARGADGSAVELGGKSAACGSLQTPLFAMLDTDLNARWIKTLDAEGVQGASVVQNCGLTVCGGNLWFAAQFNGKYTDPANTANTVASATKSTREGLIIKMDAADGSWISATTSRAAEFTPAAAKTGIQGYFKILQSPDHTDKIYAFGYVMNASVGVFLREYDAQTLEANVDNAWSLITGGGVPTCQDIAHNPESNYAYISARGNNAYNIGSITTEKAAGWSLALTKFAMPAELKTSSAISIESDSAGAPVEHYTLQGMRVDGDNLAPGIYIRRQGQKADKIFVR